MAILCFKSSQMASWYILAIMSTCREILYDDFAIVEFSCFRYVKTSYDVNFARGLCP